VTASGEKKEGSKMPLRVEIRTDHQWDTMQGLDNESGTSYVKIQSSSSCWKRKILKNIIKICDRLLML
jgi:hypothetical protein